MIAMTIKDIVQCYFENMRGFGPKDAGHDPVLIPAELTINHQVKDVINIDDGKFTVVLNTGEKFEISIRKLE